MVPRSLGEKIGRAMSPTIRRTGDPNEIAEALGYVPADEYDRWLQVGMALKLLGDDFFPVWVKRSQSASDVKFKEGEREKKWATFKLDYGRVVTAATIFYWASRTVEADEEHPRTVNAFSVPRECSLGGGREVQALRERRLVQVGWYAMDEARRQRDHRNMQGALGRARHRTVRKKQIAELAAPVDKNRVAMLDKTIKAIDRIANRLDYVVPLIESDPAVRCFTDEFDQKPWLLNCQNGTLDLDRRTEGSRSGGHAHADHANRLRPESRMSSVHEVHG